MSYRYNGAGERVHRTGSGKTVHTVFDPQGHWIGDYDAYGQPLQQAIWLGDLRWAWWRGSTAWTVCSTSSRTRWAARGW